MNIDKHIILSSAKYLLANSHVDSALCGSNTNYKYSSNNLESFIADHLYAENAPGNTEIKPKNDSNPLSMICPIVYSNNYAFSALIKHLMIYEMPLINPIVILNGNTLMRYATI